MEQGSATWTALGSMVSYTVRYEFDSSNVAHRTPSHHACGRAALHWHIEWRACYESAGTGWQPLYKLPFVKKSIATDA